jgi:hypothetical protein
MHNWAHSGSVPFKTANIFNSQNTQYIRLCHGLKWLVIIFPPSEHRFNSTVVHTYNKYQNNEMLWQHLLLGPANLLYIFTFSELYIVIYKCKKDQQDQRDPVSD